jgi:hypothetical protein
VTRDIHSRLAAVNRVARVAETESDFLGWVLDWAERRGWRRAHFRPARTAAGWRTPVMADGAGFPDLCLVRPPRVIFAELKSDKGALGRHQTGWRTDLEACPGVEFWVWRPADRPEILDVLA